MVCPDVKPLHMVYFVKVVDCKITLIMPLCDHFYLIGNKRICGMKYLQTHLKTGIPLKNVNAPVSCHFNPLTWIFHKDVIKNILKTHKTNRYSIMSHLPLSKAAPQVQPL